MIITISGHPGSGKTTVSDYLAKKLNFKHYHIGGMRRELAKKRGLSIIELNKLKENTDKEFDEYQKKLGKTQDNIIIEGRLGFYFIPNSIKIFLDVKLKEASIRLLKRQKLKDLRESLEFVRRRIRLDRERYKKHYKIKYDDKSNYDLVINTTNLTIEQTGDVILDYIKRRKK
ncbi:cytidylate kinase family protein [archaeon]|nr:cytidylate kinase family protein [archaeon]